MKLALTTIILSLFYTLGYGQDVVTGYSTYYDDSFKKWIVYSEEDEGLIELVWPLQENWSEWAFRLGEHSGTIRSTWRNSYDQWTITIDGEEYRARTVYKGDFRTLEIKNADLSLTMYYDEFDESWSGEDYPVLQIDLYTRRRGDPRDWDVEQNGKYIVPIGFQVAATFLPIFFLSPKY